MKTRIGQKLILFRKTFKIIIVRFSVSPGHMNDAIYSQKKCKMSMKIPPKTAYMKRRISQQFILIIKPSNGILSYLAFPRDMFVLNYAER